MQGSYVKYIQQETGTRVQIKGFGSGFIEQETGKESEEPLYIHITWVVWISFNQFMIDSIEHFDRSGPDEGQVERAKVLTEDLLLVVRQEHAKTQYFLNQQQMQLHQAQAQYAAYSAMAAVGVFSMWVHETGYFFLLSPFSNGLLTSPMPTFPRLSSRFILSY
jgi:hypothetical protein